MLDPSSRTALLEPVRAWRWRPVHDVVGPLTARTDVDGLYVAGGDPGVTGAAERTGTGVRRPLRVPARATASFGTYFNAFPAAHWRRWTASRAVRLRIAVDAAATLVLLRSDADGLPAVVDRRQLLPGTTEAVEVSIEGCADGGLVWFDLKAGGLPVTVLHASWAVRTPPVRESGLVIGMPTIDRPDFVAATLQRLADAPDALDRVRAVLVVDHGRTPVRRSPGFRAAADRLRGLIEVIEQPNLGGSGGFSRVLHRAEQVPDAGFVTLLDDDIQLEPVSLVRAYEFGRRTERPAIVGGQMLDLARGGVLHAGAEVVDRRTFWWGPHADDAADQDLVARPLAAVGALHAPLPADYAGWWMCQVPLRTVRELGAALPYFLKWDDAEYGLRAAAAGVPTVSLLGTAVWHVTWQQKDDEIEWPAYFHARNRVVTALVHGARSGVPGLLLASLLLDLKQLLALQYGAVALRHRALHDVRSGPELLDGSLATVLAEVRAVHDARATGRIPGPGAAEPVDPPIAAMRPACAPTGLALVLWASLTLIRQLLAPMARTDAPARLAPHRARWWVVAGFDSVLAPAADGVAHFRYVRDRRRLVGGIGRSIRVHGALARDWAALAGRYRAAAPRLASLGSWSARFAALDAAAARA